MSYFKKVTVGGIERSITVDASNYLPRASKVLESLGYTIKDEIGGRVIKEEQEESSNRQTNNGQVRRKKMKKGGKIKAVIEALQQKVLTTDDMIALGVSKSTASTLHYFLKRKGYTIEKTATDDGKLGFKITASPAVVA